MFEKVGRFLNLLFPHHYRYFVLNNEAGLLEYFVNEQSRNQKPRGTLQLAGAVISPSDEDSHTFTVNPASGEQYKLRGMGFLVFYSSIVACSLGCNPVSLVCGLQYIGLCLHSV